MRSPVSRVLSATAVVVSFCALGPACIHRPVGIEQPQTKISFETLVAQPAIDKIDLLLMIDNSKSMADKQRILAEAVPDLLDGLVRPKCVDKKTRVPTGESSDPTKPDEEACAAGSEPAFAPITDMHIGVISSSLGGMGSGSCSDTAHEDDRGHLLARGQNGDVAAAGDLHFLAWYPDVARNKDKKRHPEPPVPKTTDVEALGASFRDLVIGVGQDGCGLEAQLESVYHFLVQPDPWVTIARSGDHATYGTAVDEELLRQRAAFLRPDSLVAVIALTDEDDSTSDPLSYGGTGWRFMDGAPRDRATAACGSDPSSAKCTSCAFAPDDAACSPPQYAKADDDINVRFQHMKQRFGVDPQFPTSRYVDALTKTKVARREAEHVGGIYTPKPGCLNPLFAAKLPTSADDELCLLEEGPRTPSLVYFALIGGVPNALVPSDSTKIDWTKILGADPAHLDDTGIDPHMIQSSKPRAGVDGDYETAGKDLELACTFDLGDFRVDDDHPVLRAYPTRRELIVVNALGDQGVVASLCPAQLDARDADDFGYRPAVRSITTRLERSLIGSCLPRAVERDADGQVPCLVLAVLPDEGPDSDCERFGLAAPAAGILGPFRAKLAKEQGERATRFPVCNIPQVITPPGALCKEASKDPAFCYVEAPTLTKCANALAFSTASQKLAGARFSMQCIEQSRQPDLATAN